MAKKSIRRDNREIDLTTSASWTLICTPAQEMLNDMCGGLTREEIDIIKNHYKLCLPCKRRLDWMLIDQSIPIFSVLLWAAGQARGEVFPRIAETIINTLGNDRGAKEE